ncbi:cytochrome c maturation protein CcmE [Rubrimonas sp.]|uniref:cytochrome c maturation protein CcmE n=1 Tax=Rubrimonas sp. TaxID=2036015 RepID=UPI002FDCDE59
MAMTRKKRRILMLSVAGVLMASATALATVAFRDSLVFFMPPTELLSKDVSPNQRLRVGGMVVEGTVMRGEGETVAFDVTDYESTVRVEFAGVLPDLFKEGEGIVAEGHWRDGRFVAREVLAKHDEKYMPPAVADTLREPRTGI